MRDMMSENNLEMKERKELNKSDLKLLIVGDLVDVYPVGSQALKNMRYIGFGGEGLVYVLDEEDRVVGVKNWVIIRGSDPKSKQWIKKAFKI